MTTRSDKLGKCVKPSFLSWSFHTWNLLLDDLMWSYRLWTKLSLSCLLWRSHKEFRRAACGSQLEGWRHLVYALIMNPWSIPFSDSSLTFFIPCPIRMELQISKFLAVFCGRWNTTTRSFFLIPPRLCTHWIARRNATPVLVFCIYLLLASHRTF